MLQYITEEQALLVLPYEVSLYKLVSYCAIGLTLCSAGLPTIIHPFFGDQYFWASRVQKLGAGLQLNSLKEKDLTTAFRVGSKCLSSSDRGLMCI